MPNTDVLISFLAAHGAFVIYVMSSKSVAAEFFLEHRTYYHGRITREEANSILKKEGDFIVSKGQEGDPSEYFLSVLFQGEKHFLLGRDPTGQWFLDENAVFSRLHDLIESHNTSQKPLTVSVPAVLVKPVRRRKITLDIEDVIKQNRIWSDANQELWSGAWLTSLGEVPASIREVTVRSLTPEQHAAIGAEAKTLQNLIHPNLVRFYGVAVDGNRVTLLTELVPGGVLTLYLQSRRPPVQQMVQFAVEAAKALEFLESNGVIHKQLGAKWCYIGENQQLKVADFGLSAEEVHNKTASHPLLALKWAAPEVIARRVGAGTECVDRHDLCPFWAEAGECHANPDFMFHMCRPACAACDQPEDRPSNPDHAQDNRGNHTPPQTSNTREQDRSRQHFEARVSATQQPPFNSADNQLFPQANGRMGAQRTRRPTPGATAAFQHPAQLPAPSGPMEIRLSASPPRRDHRVDPAALGHNEPRVEPHGFDNRQTPPQARPDSQQVPPGNRNPPRRDQRPRPSQPPVHQNSLHENSFLPPPVNFQEPVNPPPLVGPFQGQNNGFPDSPPPLPPQEVNLINGGPTRFEEPPPPRPPQQNRNFGPRPPRQFCSRLMSQSLQNASHILRSEGIFVTFEDTSSRDASSFDAIKRMIERDGCTTPLLPPRDCRHSPCFSLMYRSMDGMCNNLIRPSWGSAFTPLVRQLQAKYRDMVKVPISEFNSELPPAREVSQFLLRSTQNVVNEQFNGMLMQWGQFIAHDIVKTATHPHESCTRCDDNRDRCMHIPVQIEDVRATTFGCDRGNAEPCCVKGPRSPPICGTGQSSPKEQMNQNTAFIDGSQIYGSSAEDAREFRDGQSPFLKAEFVRNQVFMPFNREDCPSLDNCKAQFLAGDDRVNVFIGLASLHNVFLREHARVADSLIRLNPGWDAERIFQEARKIVGAEMQVITFEGWLPKILGPRMYTQFIGPYRGYDPELNPAVTTEVAGAAFRFGHGMITESFAKVDSQGNEVGRVGFTEGLLTSETLLSTGEMELLLRGMMLSPVKRPHRFADSTVNNLFGNQDLAALNIQRGREMGITDYNTWREFCGFPRANTVDDFRDKMLDPAVIENLKHFYKSPNDVDLFVGAMLEDPLTDGMVGPTLACLLGRQFHKLRDGDRFWYENSGVFSERQLEELRKASLSKILCDNLESFGTAPPDAFQLVGIRNFAECFQLPALDFEAWRE